PARSRGGPGAWRGCRCGGSPACSTPANRTASSTSSASTRPARACATGWTRQAPPPPPGAVGRGGTARGARVWIGVTALGALAEAHDRGVLHLALDLDDVIVGDGDRVCLVDFGIGAAAEAGGR